MFSFVSVAGPNWNDTITENIQHEINSLLCTNPTMSHPNEIQSDGDGAGPMRVHLSSRASLPILIWWQLIALYVIQYAWAWVLSLCLLLIVLLIRAKVSLPASAHNSNVAEKCDFRKLQNSMALKITQFTVVVLLRHVHLTAKSVLATNFRWDRLIELTDNFGAQSKSEEETSAMCRRCVPFVFFTCRLVEELIEVITKRETQTNICTEQRAIIGTGRVWMVLCSFGVFSGAGFTESKSWVLLCAKWQDNIRRIKCIAIWKNIVGAHSNEFYETRNKQSSAIIFVFFAIQPPTRRLTWSISIDCIIFYNLTQLIFAGQIIWMYFGFSGGAVSTPVDSCFLRFHFCCVVPEIVTYRQEAQHAWKIWTSLFYSLPRLEWMRTCRQQVGEQDWTTLCIGSNNKAEKKKNENKT